MSAVPNGHDNDEDDDDDDDDVDDVVCPSQEIKPCKRISTCMPHRSAT